MIRFARRGISPGRLFLLAALLAVPLILARPAPARPAAAPADGAHAWEPAGASAPTGVAGGPLLRVDGGWGDGLAGRAPRLEVFTIRGRKAFDLPPIGRGGAATATYAWPVESSPARPVPSGLDLALARGVDWRARAWKVRYVAPREEVTVEGAGSFGARVLEYAGSESSVPRPMGAAARAPWGPGPQGDHFADETGARLPALEDDTARIIPVDVDQDDDLDLFVAEFGPNVVQNRLWINDGRGRFTDETAARLPAIDDFTNDADAADIDGDGDLDIVVADGFDDDSYLLENDGAGHFARRSDLLPDHCPVYFGFPSGHGPGKVILPLGLPLTLDSTMGLVAFGGTVEDHGL